MAHGLALSVQPNVADTLATGSTTDCYFTIREVSDKLGVTLRALRFYEAAKLIEPRRKGRLRLYREIDVERLKAILQLKRFGFTLAEIRLLIKAGGTVPGSLGLSREGCSKQIEYLEQRIRELDTAILDLQRLLSVLP